MWSVSSAGRADHPDLCEMHATNAGTAVTSGGRVPSSSSEKESQHEDESIDGHARRCGGSLGRWCYVDRTIGLGW